MDILERCGKGLEYLKLFGINNKNSLLGKFE
jgi:hypothetical protein